MSQELIQQAHFEEQPDGTVILVDPSEKAQQEQPYAHRAIPGLTIDPVTGNVGIEAPKQEQPAQEPCFSCHGYTNWEPKP